jgi:hypothetical protein
MPLFEQLKAHVGGLIRLKTDLYWHNANSYDEVKGRVCLLLDTTLLGSSSSWVATSRTMMSRHPWRFLDNAYVLLLIDCQAKWIWISEEDVELVQ